MLKEVRCVHCSAPSTKINCEHCGELAIKPEEIIDAKRTARDFIAKMSGDPESCATYEEAIRDDHMLFAIDWMGTRDLMRALNEIHVDHDAPSLHGGSVLFAATP